LEYASDEAALTDALRLSQGMTLKCAMADLPLGGGKVVIMQSWNQVKDKDVFLKTYAKHLNRLDGLLIIGEDVGFTEEYVDIMSEVSPYVFGRSESNGGVGSPSPRTSFGVLQGIRAALKFQRNKKDLKGVKVAVQDWEVWVIHLRKCSFRMEQL
jgi:leucine dehydrogenase